MIVGYARVSTDGQTLDAQQSALVAAGAEKVFAEKVSGAVTDRKQLGKALTTLGQGDVLLVTRLDRLARSTRDLLNVLDAPWPRPVQALGASLMGGPTPPPRTAG
jgi:DNA invertase Pin-like site-specific DNA recombinase